MFYEVHKAGGFEHLLQELEKISSYFNISNHKIKTKTLFVVFRQIAEKGISFQSNYVASEMNSLKFKIDNSISKFEKDNFTRITYSLIKYSSSKKITLVYHFGFKVESIFKINKYLSLKLEKKKTNIYINNKYFTICKHLLIDIPRNEIESFDKINSIDELILRNRNSTRLMNPKTEFWGHCSNLQAWYENNYDTRLLDSYLAFPLLQKLSMVGDSLARKVFKDEIAIRIEANYLPTTRFLINRYLKDFESEELNIIFEKIKESNIYDKLTPSEIKYLTELGDPYAKQSLKERLLRDMDKKDRYIDIITRLVYKFDSHYNQYYSDLFNKKDIEIFRKKLIQLFGTKLFNLYDRFSIPQKLKFRFFKDKDIRAITAQYKTFIILEIEHNQDIDSDIIYKKEYSINKRSKFKKIRRNRIFYDFDLPRKDETPKFHSHRIEKMNITPVLPYRYVTWSLKILNHSKDIRIAIPENKGHFKIYSEKEGLVIYIAQTKLYQYIYKDSEKKELSH